MLQFSKDETMSHMWRLLLLALSLGYSFASDVLPPSADRALSREIFKQIIEIKSGFTTGSTTAVAEALAARLKAAGFPSSDLFIGGAAPNKANLVVRYHGSGGALKPLLLLAHSDVVEAKREDWSFDPFVFTERDGYFTGRATSHDKAQANRLDPPTSSVISAKPLNQTATSSSRSRPTKKAVDLTTGLPG